MCVFSAWIQLRPLTPIADVPHKAAHNPGSDTSNLGRCSARVHIRCQNFSVGGVEKPRFRKAAHTSGCFSSTYGQSLGGQTGVPRGLTPIMCKVFPLWKVASVVAEQWYPRPVFFR